MLFKICLALVLCAQWTDNMSVGFDEASSCGAYRWPIGGLHILNLVTEISKKMFSLSPHAEENPQEPKKEEGMIRPADALTLLCLSRRRTFSVRTAQQHRCPTRH